MSLPTQRQGGPGLLFLALAMLGLGACTDDGASPISAPADAPLAARAAAAEKIPDQYVVLLKPDVRNVDGFVRGLDRSPQDSVLFVYEHAVKGFAARLAPASVDALRKHPFVLEILADEYGVPDQAVWSLDRSDQRDLPLNGAFSPTATGAGVNVYVVDSGIRRTHREFDYGARARHAYTAVLDGRGSDDCSGHGTHVAATAAGSTYGVARQATVHAVRISNCTGAATASGAIAALDWVRANHQKPAVVNLSYTWSARTDIDNAVSSLTSNGVPVVTSAGNSNADACNYSPKRVSTVLTVANSASDDFRAPDSNWGTCVHLFAPGTGVTSAWNGSDTDSRTLSGTSMASPLAAGVVALYLQGDPYAPVWKVRDAVIGSATKGKIGDARGTPNRLIYAHSVYFETTVSGPDAVTSGGYLTWEAQPVGGAGPYTYQWSLYRYSTGIETMLGTGQTQSVYVTPGDGDFSIGVVVTSAGEVRSASMNVYDSGANSCGSFCPTF